MSKRILSFILAFIMILCTANYALAVFNVNSLDIKEINNARTALGIINILYPTEGIDTNVVTMAQEIVNVYATSVTVSLDSSNNSQISQDGTVIYGNSLVTNNVIFKLSKNISTNTHSVFVEVPAKYIDYDTLEVEKAKTSLINLVSYPAEKSNNNILPLIQKVIDLNSNGVIGNIVSTNNSQIDGSGNIIYGIAETTVEILVGLTRNNVYDMQVIKAVVPAKYIEPINTYPTVTINTPINNSSYTKGDSITFTGIANDVEDGTLSNKIAWSSSINGSLGSGDSVSNTSLSAGTHTITAVVTDSKGLTSSKEITIVVSAVTPTGTTCSSLGMIKGIGTTNAATNWAKLSTEAAKGTTIVVDGIYSIDSGSAKNIKKLTLMGTNSTVSQLHLYEGSYFNLTGSSISSPGNVTVNGIGFYSEADGISLFTCIPKLITDISIKFCHFEGNIKMLQQDYRKYNLNYNTDPSYINNFYLENNTFHNIRGGTSNSRIMNSVDSPIRNFVCRNNKITNFGYMFMFCGIQTGSTNDAYLRKANNAIIEDNVVICEDSFNPATTIGTMGSDLYYCFVLWEGNKVECRRNVFEGFHMNQSGKVVYDNYFTVNTLIYEYNTYKNNVNFTTGETLIDLMKSKQGTTINGVKPNRLYQYNKFIMEASYADKFGKSRTTLRKQICSFNGANTDFESIIVQHNTFNLYCASFYFYNKWQGYWKFHDNIIISDVTENFSTPQALVWVDNYPSTTSHTTRQAIVTDNTIQYNAPPSGSFRGSSVAEIVKYTANSGDKTSITVTGNKLKVYGWKYTSQGAEASKCSNSPSVNISGNTVINYPIN